MAKQINKLLNANVYFEDKSWAGRADEFELPVLKFLMSEHKPLGQIGTTEYASGIDKMEAKIKWNGPYADVFKKMANPWKGMKIMARGSMDVYEAGDRVAQQPYVCYMTCNSKSVPLGNLKQNDNAEFESDLSVTYVKLEINRVAILEFDAENNILIVDGVDLLKEWRDNLGL